MSDLDDTILDKAVTAANAGDDYPGIPRKADGKPDRRSKEWKARYGASAPTGAGPAAPARKAKATAAAPPKTMSKQDYHEVVAGTLSMVKIGATIAAPHPGALGVTTTDIIAAHTDQVADAVAELAIHDPRVGKALASLGAGGAWTTAAVAVGGLLFAVTANTGVLGTSPTILGVAAQVTPGAAVAPGAPSNAPEQPPTPPRDASADDLWAAR